MVSSGYGSQNTQVIASPGPGKGRNPRQPPGPPGQGPATPQQPQPIAYPDRGSPRALGRQTPPHQQLQIPDVGNVLADLDPDSLPPHQKHEAQDWFAVFNPRIRRVLDVDILHSLVHESVVCCVRFSLDGRYIATGCNRSAQIFEVSTGRQVTKLQDETVDKDGDLYIRSVCFSPDGKYLATGAEDKQIRVSRPCMGLCTNCVCLSRCNRSGISRRVLSDIHSLDTSKTSIPLTSPVTVSISLLVAATARSVSGISRVAGRFSTLSLKMV